jgi:hypothetical protein
LIELPGKRFFKLQAPLKLIGHFVRRHHVVLDVDLAFIVLLTRPTEPPATATQAFEVVASDFVLQ